MGHLILTGATGTVGAGVLHQMLVNPNVTKISVLSRRPVAFAEGKEKVKVYIHKDFKTYPTELLEELKGAKGCVWSLGVSQNDVDAKTYEEITVDYPISAAKAFSTLSESFNFVLVSGEGATLTPGRFTPIFGRVKGQAESSLLQLSQEPAYKSLHPYSLRPAAVDPSAHKEIQDFVPQLPTYRKILAPILLPFARVAWSSMHSPTADLGRVLTDLALSDGAPLSGEGISGEGRTISNVGMRRLGGL